MIGARGDTHLRGWLSGVAALVAHALVLLGMPDATAQRAPRPTTLWFTIASEQPAVKAAVLGAVPGLQERRRPAAPTPQRRTARVARTATSASTNVAPPATEAGSAQAEAGALVGAGSALGAGSVDPSGGGAVVTRPALLATRNPCLGYFPASAHVDHGRVQIHVRVDESGRTRATEVMAEAPYGHDFGRAARACAAALRFAPARDALGAAVAADAKLELYFHRT